MNSTQGIEIGNWLLDKNCIPKQITEIYDDSVTLGSELNHISTVEPIPLTTEMLESNVFGKKGQNFGIFNDYFDLELHEYNDGMWLVSYSSTEMDLPATQVSICFVHQLQVIFTLLGINKSIVL